MVHRARLILLEVALLAGTATRPGPAAEVAPTPEQLQFFEARVRPILAENCFKCHGPDKQTSGLRLDSRASVLAGGDTGPAIVPGTPEESLLIAAIRREDETLKMPPARKLDSEQVADLTRWVQMGAPWPDGGEQTAAPPRRGEFRISDEDRAHWAFRPVRRPPVPQVNDRAWMRNPIDAFLLARLEARGLRPNRAASPLELIRRASYDLTGLPPSPAEVASFLADSSPDAYERLIDRLLASPRYGEKWGRHWLDLVRFAETNSYERDNPKPNAWRYRDYVIRSFNDDKPYDRFVREHLAGDELPDGDRDALIATGYYRLGIWDDEPADRDLARYDGLDDIVATTGQVFLGLTIDCARCHDHKFDPIPQEDYYRLLAFFHNINPYRNGGPTDEVPIRDPGAEEAYRARVRDLERRRAETRAALAAIEAEGARAPDRERSADYRRLQRQLQRLEQEKPARDAILCVTEAGPSAPETFILLRGNAHARGHAVAPGFLRVLGGSDPVIPSPPRGSRTTGRRTVLADWITAPDNPLTARVLVNRLWQHHFGRGIVRSPNNFGLLGDAPSHPDLLDWLGAELVTQGWRLKPLHRLIMTSAAYRMSSRASPEALAQDPENELFGRFDLRRLTAEEIRDSVLAVSGTLNLAMYGPGVYPELPREVLAGQSVPGLGWRTSPPDQQARRSVYIHVKRSLLVPLLEGFDLAETDRSAPVRFSTTQPSQALTLLNGAFLHRQSAALAHRLRREAGDDLHAQVRLALRLALAREPGAEEIRRGVALIESLATSEGLGPSAAREAFALMVLNLNEFLYLD